MKKVIISLITFLVVFTSYAQVKIGIKVSPGILNNRVFAKPDSVEVSNNGLKIKVPFGVFIDIPFTERYYFNTGVNLAGKNAELNYRIGNSPEEFEKVKMQYLQIPLTFKLLTDEIAVDKRIYIQFGPVLEVLINSKGDPEKYISKVLFGDISFLFSGGLDMKIGPNSSLSFGLSYYRGLLNIVKTSSLPAEEFSVKNDMFLLEIAIKP